MEKKQQKEMLLMSHLKKDINKSLVAMQKIQSKDYCNLDTWHYC